jgi:putative nucleotidyltransferase with HDIG domain
VTVIGNAVEFRVDILDALLASECRVELLRKLRSRLSAYGVEIGFGPDDSLPFDPEGAVRYILKGVAKGIKSDLGVGEAVVAVFSDARIGFFLGESSEDSGGDGGPVIDAVQKRLEKGYSPSFGTCTVIDCLTGEYKDPQAGGPGNVALSPISVGESVVGLVAAATGSDGRLTTEQEIRLMLMSVLLAGAVDEVVSSDRNEERLRSLAGALSGALDARIPGAKGHSQRVAMYAMAMVNEMCHDKHDPAYQDLRHRIRIGALLHDIGKVRIPESILNKGDDLTEEERELINQHPVVGADVLTACYGLGGVVPGVLYHHERFDGSGYPSGLSGGKIPISARVIALADAFDNLTSDQAVQEDGAHGEAIRKLQDKVSKWFDPEVFNALLEAHKKGTLKHVRLPARWEISEEALDLAVEKVYGRQLKSIPSLPPVLSKVNSLLDDPEASLREIANLLSTDSGLASRVLKLANSAYYGLPRVVSTIPLAATILGISAIKNHVVNIAYADSMTALGGTYEGYGVIWSHSLSTAAWARAIASTVPDVDVEEAFTAGLVHDIGKALSLRLRPEAFGRIVSQFKKTGRPVMALEEQVIGFDHARIGGWMAARWKLPEPLVNSIRWHHDPERAKEQSDEIYRVVRIIHIADIAASAALAAKSDFMSFLLQGVSPGVLRELGSRYLAELEVVKEGVEEAEKKLQETFADVAACIS